MRRHEWHLEVGQAQKDAGNVRLVVVLLVETCETNVVGFDGDLNRQVLALCVVQTIGPVDGAVVIGRQVGGTVWDQCWVGAR